MSEARQQTTGQAAVGGAVAVPTGRPFSDRALDLVERFGLLGLLAAMIVVFSLVLPNSFPTHQTFTSILSSQPTVLFATLAVLVPLVVGEFDLSIGYGLGFVSVFFTWLMEHGFAFVPALVVVAALALLIGAINGFLVVRLGMNSFISTLGTGTVMSGLILYFSEGQILSEGLPKALFSATQSELFGIALPVFYVLAAAIVLWYVFEHTPLGRRMYATGAGEQAARLTGIATNRIRFFSFVAGAGLWCIAGLVNTGRVGAAYPEIGPSFLLPAFAATFLGATAIKPRYFNVWGTVFAALLVAVGVTGFEQLGVKSWIEPVFNGIVLLVAVAISVRTAVLRERMHD